MEIALDRARLPYVSNLPDNRPRCGHGRGATVVIRWGATTSWVHRILNTEECMPCADSTVSISGAAEYTPLGDRINT